MSIRQNGIIIAGASQYHPDLFDWKWADHILNDVQWLRADTFSWQSGAVYEKAYNELLNDICKSASWEHSPYEDMYTKAIYPKVGDGVYIDSDCTNLFGYVDAIDEENHTITYSGYVFTFKQINYVSSSSQTISGTTITVYTGHTGKQIVLATDENNVASIYASTGVAWYYILDTVNQRFKLPRTKFGFTGLRDTVGNYVEPGLPDHNHKIIINTKWGSKNNNNGPNWCGDDATRATNIAATSTNASESNSIYGNSDTVQPPATQMYLYFYVGSFTQTALENTAGLNASLFNGKADLDLGNVSATGKATSVGWVMPDYSAGISLSGWQATNTNFTVPCAGYIQVVMATTGGALETFYIDDIPCCALINSFTSYVGNAVGGRFIEGGVHTFRSAVPSRTQSVIFYPCKGVL